MTDTREMTFGASKLTIGRNYIAVDPKEWHEENAILVQAPEHASIFHLDEAAAMRDHLTSLIDEIVENLPTPSVGAPVGTVLVNIDDKKTRLAKLDEDFWIDSTGVVYTDAQVVWSDWESVPTEPVVKSAPLAEPLPEPVEPDPIIPPTDPKK